MPPEPLPWDRKDFFKERKYERSESSSLGSAPRWRDSSSSHYGSSREYVRWTGNNDFRRFSGHGKQGGWHLVAEESGHGYGPSRCSEKVLENEDYRPRGDGKYARGRENRGSVSQRDWKGHSWEMNNGSPNSAVRLHGNNDRSDDVLTFPQSHAPNPELVNTWDQLNLKDQQDNNKVAGISGLGTGQKGDKDSTLDWKPLKWARTGSLSSRGSGFSHSSSSKSLGGADSNEGKTELQPKNATPVRSPSGDAAACVTSAPLCEETTSRKKPRLNWGEGLAKYEKKKVEGPDVSMNKDGVVISVANVETIFSQSSNLADKSPRVLGFSDCASPATPSSVACSSSPGVEEKSFGKAVNADADVSNLCSSNSIGSHVQLDGFSFNLEKFDISSVSSLGSSITELLQSDDPTSVDSSFVRSSTMNKLLLWKAEISKALEMTETEIDSLETELKSLKFECGNRSPNPAGSNSFLGLDSATICNEQRRVSNNIPHPPPLQMESYGVAEKIPLCNATSEDVDTAAKGCDSDSPTTATSKFVESASLVEAAPLADFKQHIERSGDLETAQSPNLQLKHFVHCNNEVITNVHTEREVNLHRENGRDASFSTEKHLDEVNKLCNLVLVSNKECAIQASDVLNKFISKDQCKIDLSSLSNVSLSHMHRLVKEKIALRKRFLRFKERVVTLKFKAFLHLWKEDLRLLSVTKYRAKSQKKSELSLRVMHSGYQKHRSSVRSRFPSPAGNVNLVPKSDIVNFASKLLSDCQVKLYRSNLKMPSLILDENERVASCFSSSNGLVEDPCAVEKEREMINPWTSAEIEIFIDKLSLFGKDFRKIASFLNHKTTADCVEFYYKNHKSDCFERAKKSKKVKSSTNYLVASGKKWNREMNSASLHILGDASAIAANADNAMRRRQRCSNRIFLGDFGDLGTSQRSDNILERSNNANNLHNESEAVAADVLAGICGSVSSEAMSSCITTSVDPGENIRDLKSQKLYSVVKQLSASDVTENVDEETCSDESCGEMDPTDWTDHEKSLFIQAVSTYGKDFTMISRFIRTRTRDQCKVFFSKARKCLGLDLMQPRHQDFDMLMSDDAHGGGGDKEDACALEKSSIICNDNLGSRAVPSEDGKQDEFDAASRKHVLSDLNGPDDNVSKRALGERVSEAPQMELSTELTCNKPQQSEPVPPLKILANSVGIEADRAQMAEGGDSVEETMLVENAVDTGLPNSNAVVENRAPAEVSTSGTGNLQEQEFPSLENDSSQIGSLQDSKRNKCTSLLPVDSSSLNLGVESIHQVSAELDTLEKPLVMRLPVENNPATTNSGLQDSSSGQTERKQDQKQLPSTPETKSSDKLGQTFKDEHIPHFSSHLSLKNDQLSQIFMGCPLQIPTKNETNGNISCRSVPEMQTQLNARRNSSDQFTARDCFLQKCNGSKPQCLTPAPLNLSPHTEKAGDQARSFSDGEKHHRNGEVVLFGKVLSNPSPLQDQNSGSNENEGRGAPSSKLNSKVSVFKFSGHDSTQASDTTFLKQDQENSYSCGLDNGPMRSYGFWDGSRIQTGFPSIPDSAILLAKYPDAFDNFPVSSSKVDQQPFHSDPMSLFSARDVGGSNGVVDYQMYQRHDGPKVQPFTMDVKHRQDIYSEMQKLNGFEAISNLQQPGRSVAGMNVVGRGGILVGGPCTNVTDPVAAIKMHFAKADQYGGHNSGTMGREEESWRGKGDIGR
ncbi:hypothetical protein K2173_011704 [Erythroxylum novogranatense]|uniref:SANT domain-containing protein n=1 Tax=Erythroxylum novogranatense TaxID=1862640 RepID=A0AAV8T0U0_9ROSI|nr:hypothetical protein K2173_011704 [Erythroxylum novogranatense]